MADSRADSRSNLPPLVLVTGASGFVATWLIKELMEMGEYRVRGTVRNKSNQEKIKPLLNLVPDAKYPLELVEANLNDKECWSPAVEGCTYVFHVASPFPPPSAPPTDENEVILPALNGVTNVLTAVSESSSVKRVVVTGSTVAVKGYTGIPGYPSDSHYTEENWMAEEACSPYEKSKLKAERLAWDFVEKLDRDKAFELVMVLPCYIQGPLLSAVHGVGSANFSSMLLKENIPMWNTCFGIVDVRDVAAAEIAAMFVPSAAGKRFILSSETTTGKEFSEIVKNEFEPQGYTVVISDERSIQKCTLSNDRMRNQLGITPRPIKQSILDTCYSMIELGFVAKTPGYLGHPESRTTI